MKGAPLGCENQALFITPETLEDRLLYDDVFVDYFNVFLQLKAFSIPIRYERLDGFYLERYAHNDPELQQVIDYRGKFLWQGAVTSWIKKRRLPFFLRSQLFLEFKLCKLLLRKLSETSRMPQSCLELKGYSRAPSPFPVSPEWSISPVGRMSQASWPVKAQPQHYYRPFGSACSVPAMLSLALETRLKLLEGPPSKATSTAIKGDSTRPMEKTSVEVKEMNLETRETEGKKDVSFGVTNAVENFEKEDIFDCETFANRSLITSAQCYRIKNSRKRRTSLFTPSLEKKGEAIIGAVWSGRRRTKSAPARAGVKTRSGEINRSVFLEYSEVDMGFGEEDTILDFDEQDFDGTEVELQSMVDETKRNLQEMKEDALKSCLGMKEFRDFLCGTSGIHLLNFWLDVERYKDLEASEKESSHTLQMLRIKLFREINDKYKTHLTAEAKKMIAEALNHDGLTKDLFTRTQYDTLRRIRSYWIPRFLVHKEKTRDQRMIQRVQSRSSGDGTSLGFLPAISVVHSLPPRGDWCVELAGRSCDWSKNLALTDVRARSPRKRVCSGTDKRDDYTNFLDGILSEKEAGWPFRYFLERTNKKNELSSLLFWQSVEELKNEETRGCDRHLHLCNAWVIVKQYLSDETDTIVNLNEADKRTIIEKLRKSVEVSSTLFKSGQTGALVTLRTPWEEYQQDEKQTLFRSTKVSSVQQSSSGSKNEKKHGLLYHSFSPGKWYPRYPESSPSERQLRLHTALTIAENIQATRMSVSPQKSRASMKKRRSATKPKAVRTKDEKAVKFDRKKEKQEDSDSTSGEDSGKDEVKVPERPPPQFKDFFDDKVTMSSFKQYIQNTEGRHGVNNLAMCLAIETYKAIPSSRKAERTQQASQIFKDFFDQSSRKSVELPASIPYQVQNECPSSPILLEAQNHVLPDIQSSFRQFYKSHRAQKLAPETDVSHPAHPRTISKSDAPFASSSFLVYYKRRRNKFKGPGRVQPTKEDKFSFIKELRDTYGALSSRLELFRRYLDNNDDVQSESVSKLENDLFFYLQVQKFKDLFYYMDDATLTKKVDAIVDCFLDSATPPSVQIDISSDLAGRIVHKAQSFHTRSKIPREQRDSSIFDEAQNIVLKELLPFWAGFTKQHDSPSTKPEPDKLPPTRREIIMKRRYSDFKKFPLKKRPVSLRSVLPRIGESKRELNFTVAEGLAWKIGTKSLQFREQFKEKDPRMEYQRIRTVYTQLIFEQARGLATEKSHKRAMAIRRRLLYLHKNFNFPEIRFRFMKVATKL